MSETRTFQISGMTCDHCASSLKKALRELPGVSSAEVSFAGNQAQVEVETFVSDDTLLSAVTRRGFGAERLAERRVP